MKISFYGFLFLFLLGSCAEKYSKEQREMLEILKKDLELKEIYAKGLNELFEYKHESPTTASRIEPWYQLNKDLYKYYEDVKLNSNNILPIDSLNRIIRLTNEKKINYVKPSTFIQQPGLIKDSLEFIKFKSVFLSKVLDVKMTLAMNVDATTISCFGNPYVFFILPTKQAYHENDSFEAGVVLSKKPETKIKILYKVFKNQQAIDSGMIWNAFSKFNNLEKGHYRIVYKAFEVTEVAKEFIPNNKPAIATYTHEFDVK